MHAHTHRSAELPLNAAHSCVAPVPCRSVSNLCTPWFSRKTLGPKITGRSLASPPLPPPVPVSPLRGRHTQGACQQRTWISHGPVGWTSEITVWGDGGGNPSQFIDPSPQVAEGAGELRTVPLKGPRHHPWGFPLSALPPRPLTITQG